MDLRPNWLNDLIMAVQTLLLTFGFYLLFVLMMAIGIMISGRSLRGSCGGSSCTCSADGKETGSCEYDGPVLPTHPS
jgi:hypothetical protein